MIDVAAPRSLPACARISGMADADLVALSARANLRDLGGIVVDDGRRVRRGVVYRSAMLDATDDRLLDEIAALGIRTIVDLRGNRERRAWPTPWQAVGCADYWCRDHDHDAGNLLRIAEEHPGEAPARVREEMLRVYRTLPFAQRHGYRAVFEAIAGGRAPVLFHCAAGKDRTGVLAALILAAVGAAMPDIVADYTRTNAFDLEAAWVARGESFGATRAALAPLLSADPDYLAAMFDDLFARHGSVDGYLEAVLGLGDADRRRLRGALIERG